MGDNVTFRRDALDPKYMVLAKFFADMGNSQREDKAMRDKQQMLEQERKRQEAESMIKMMIDNGLFEQADALAQSSGSMTPPGGWTGIGQTLTDRKGAEIAAAAEAERLKGDQQMADIRNLQLAGQNGGFLNEGMSTETIDSPFMSMLTGKAQGAPVQMQTERELFAGSEGMTPQEATSIAAIKNKLTPEQIMAIRESGLSPQEQASKLRMDSGLMQTADQSADTAVQQRNAAVGEKRLGLDERKFSYDQGQDLKKAAAETLKTAAMDGLPPDDYTNLSKLLDDVRAAVKPQVDSLAAGTKMAAALESGSSEVAQAAMVTFMKALDDSVAREGEVAAMINRMGGRANIENAISSYTRGRAGVEFNNKMKGLMALVNEKNKALIDERLAGFDVQAKAAGSGVLSNYNEFKATIKGGSASVATKPKGVGASANVVPASDLP